MLNENEGIILDLSDHPEVKQKNIEYLNALHEAGANITEYTVLVPQYDGGIYTQDVQMFYGLNPYNFICVYTGEAGTARLYAVYHFSTTSGIPEASGWLSDESFVQTQYYYDKEATLDMAATIYFAKGQAHDYLYEEVINNSDIYFT